MSEDMSEMQLQVAEFHETFNVPVAKSPRLLSPDRIRLRERLIQEEFTELKEAEWKGDLVEIADALGDLLVVVYGTAIEHGINMKPITDEIHFSNMSKLGEDGNPIVREDGKILKGPNFFLPKIQYLLFLQQENPRD